MRSLDIGNTSDTTRIIVKAGRLPTFPELLNPLLEALRALGGSATIDEMYDKVVELEQLPDTVVSQLHDPKKGNQTEVGYRLAWARTYLKKYGLIENSSRGVWSLTAKAKRIERLDPREVVRTVKTLERKEGENKETENGALPDVSREQEWKEKLYSILTRLKPATFERLVQRVLRESGFTQVEVTGRSGDGGIDGRGIARIHGLMSFHVLFQCKRYKGGVGASEIRDFRGAMVGRADKGLFITTGTFTPAAVKEATRDGAPPIDLLSGSEFADKLRELGLGVRIENIEVVRLEQGWFENL